MQKIKTLIRLGSALVLSISTLLTVSFAGTALAAAPYTCTWTGATDDSFSTAGNWSGCNSAAPQSGDGDSLVFDVTSLSQNTTINNDISGLSLNSITFQGSNSGGYAYTITGDAVSLSGGITDSGTDPTIDTDVTLSASQAFTSTGEINFGDNLNTPVLNIGSFTLTVAAGTEVFNTGTLSGSGSVVLQGGSHGGGQINLASADSGFSGSISGGQASFIGTVPGGLGTGTAAVDDGTLCLGGFNGGTLSNNVTLGGTSALSTASGICGGGGATSFDSQQNVTLAGNVTLTADTTIDTDGAMTITGPLSGNYTLTLDSGVAGTLNITSSNNTSQTPNGNSSSQLQVTTVDAGDNQSTTPVYIGSNQEYIIDGIRGTTTVENGGILKGGGTVGALTLYKGGIVAPGHSPGCLTVNGNLNEGGTYQAEIGGTTACTNYDQLIVTSGNKVTLDDGGTPATQGVLQVSLVSGFVPKAGETFEIINNQGSQAVSDTFSGLPEGSEITVSGTVFKISYKGGDGNDVVLTVMTVPATPDTGSALGKSYVALPLIGSIFAVTGLYAISRKGLKLPNIKLH